MRCGIRFAQIRSLTGQPFAVNLFAPLPAPSEVGLPDWAALHGVPAPTPTARTFGFADQLSVVSDERVPVLSFTFGVPSTAGFTGFVIGTATTVAEAVALAAAGVDAVVAQGSEAGGHRGTFQAPLNADELAASLIGTMSLVPQMVDAVSIPVIASGGIMDGRGIAAARALGAQGVQLGTAFLATDEAGIDPGFRQALGEPTSVTAVLTGRPRESGALGRGRAGWRRPGSGRPTIHCRGCSSPNHRCWRGKGHQWPGRFRPRSWWHSWSARRWRRSRV